MESLSAIPDPIDSLVTAFACFEVVPKPSDERIQKILKEHSSEIETGQSTLRTVDSIVKKITLGKEKITESDRTALEQGIKKLHFILDRAFMRSRKGAIPQDVKNTLSVCIGKYDKFLSMFLEQKTGKDRKQLECQFSVKDWTDREDLPDEISQVRRATAKFPVPEESMKTEEKLSEKDFKSPEIVERRLGDIRKQIQSASLSRTIESLGNVMDGLLYVRSRTPDRSGLPELMELYESVVADFLEHATEKIKEEYYRLTPSVIRERLSFPPETILNCKLAVLKSEFEKKKEFETVHAEVSKILDSFSTIQEYTDEVRASILEVKHFMQDIARSLSSEEYSKLLTLGEKYNATIETCCSKFLKTHELKKQQEFDRITAEAKREQKAPRPTAEIWRVESEAPATGNRVERSILEMGMIQDVERRYKKEKKELEALRGALPIKLPAVQEELPSKRAGEVERPKDERMSTPSHSPFTGFVETVAVFFSELKSSILRTEKKPVMEEGVVVKGHKFFRTDVKAVEDELGELAQRFSALAPQKDEKCDGSLVIQGTDILKKLEGEVVEDGPSLVRDFALLRRMLVRALRFARLSKDISPNDAEKVLTAVKTYNSLVEKWSKYYQGEECETFKDTMMLSEKLKEEEVAPEAEVVVVAKELVGSAKVSYADQIVGALRKRFAKWPDAAFGKTNFVRYMVRYRLGCAMQKAAEENPAEAKKLCTIPGILAHHAPGHEDSYLAKIVADAESVEKRTEFISNDLRLLETDLGNRIGKLDKQIEEKHGAKKLAKGKKLEGLSEEIKTLEKQKDSLVAAKDKVAKAMESLKEQARRFETIASFISGNVAPRAGSKLGEAFDFTSVQEEYVALKTRVEKARAVVDETRAAFKGGRK